MITIQTATEKVIEDTPYLEEVLGSKLLNLSSVARKIKPQLEEALLKDVEIGAIVMALKRLEERSSGKNKKAFDIAREFEDISVKSNLFQITFKNSLSLGEKQDKLIKEASKNDRIFLAMSKSTQQTTFILSSSFVENVGKIFKEERELSNISNLSAITMIFSEESVKTPGVYYFVLKALARQGINIIEVVSSFTELTIVVEDQVVDKAFSVLKNLTQNN